ncbi:hypothetical protein C4552_01130 [Candidatus Parcubacteria bacterium]|nr:MAG: hypothetical protein C4552_01130 [Candidatus Parcubacteria bacterium]
MAHEPAALQPTAASAADTRTRVRVWAVALATLVATLFVSSALALLFPSALQSESGTARFAVIGDFGIAGQNEADVANLVKSWNPDLVVTTGDNNYFSGKASTIDQNIGQYYREFIYPYVGSYGTGSTVNRFFPSLGNHDWDAPGIQPYLDYFALPGNERYYEFIWGPVHFFVLDSDEREPDGITSTSVQAQWLQQALAASAAPWKIVILHHPPYTSGYHGSDEIVQWPFREWGAHAVLAGHAHVYERVIRNGLPYIVNGVGGAEIHAFKTPICGSESRHNADFGAMLAEANTTALTFSMISRSGAVVDTYTLDKAVMAANSYPVVDTVSTMTVTLPDSAFLDATVSDDGIPNPALITQWSLVKGPASVTFADAAAVDTAVEFPQGGKYILRLDASDGSLSSCDEITVTALDFSNPADLAITSFSAPSTAGAGQTLTIKNTIKNKGDGAAGASLAEFLLSTDATLDGEDILIGSKAVSALPPGATDSTATTVEIPLEVEAGTYWIIMRADADDDVVESNEGNNVASGSLRIGSDLNIASLAPSAKDAKPGATVTIKETTKNIGGTTADPSKTYFFLSVNGKLDSKDVLLGSRSVPSLAGGASSAANTDVVIPLGTAAGNYYILAEADGDDAVVEIREDNNVSAKSIKVK